MIKLSKDSKVYVYAPASVVTGGAELLHQLTHVLNSNGIDAYLVYFDSNSVNWIVSAEIPQDYKKYNIKLATEIEDLSNNIIVIYEGIFDHIQDTSKAQLLLWWLSVDNFYICSSNFLSLKDCLQWNLNFGLKQIVRRVYRSIFKKNSSKIKISLKKLRNLSALHCYQSEYAQNFLLNNKFQELLPLSDFINTEFINGDYTNAIKENKILYNPKKGYSFTKQLIEKSPELNWVPLVGFSRSELIHELRTAKIYIDFGYHPGKDRIPREAASSGCCILTNMLGSARYFEDVSIDAQYKFDSSSLDIDLILNKIKYILDNYDEVKLDFDFYRKRIKLEQEIFENHVLDIFKN